MKIFFVILIMLLMMPPAHARQENFHPENVSADLQHACETFITAVEVGVNNEGAFKAGICRGYIAGFMHGIASQRKKKWCGQTLSQLDVAKQYVAWLNTHRNTLSDEDNVTPVAFVESLNAAYACEEE